jgi:hypothetical protein
MTGRDHWTESLECPKCRKTGIVKLSQANGRALKATKMFVSI